MLMSRRELMAGVALCGSMIGYTPAFAAGPPISTLNQLAAALRTAAIATESIAANLGLGRRKRLSRQAAMQARDRLGGLASAVAEIYRQQSDLIEALDDYHAKWSTDPEGARRYQHLSRVDRIARRRTHWRNVASVTSTLLRRVASALSRFSALRSDMIDWRAVARLEHALTSRADLLSNLSRMAPPSGSAELAALGRAVEYYKRLHNALIATHHALSEYINRLGAATLNPRLRA